MKEQNLTVTNTYYANKAWCKAFVYFAICWAIAWISGTLHWLMDSPLPWQQELPYWPLFSIILLFSGALCYHIIWRRWTYHFDRVYQPLSATVFGLFWGISEGLLLLSCWHLVDTLDIGLELSALLCFCLFSGFYATWHPLYWDKYIAPEHDVEEYYFKKVWCVHTPHLILCLAYLAAYQEPWGFVIAMLHTLTGCSHYLHMPGLGKSYPQYAQHGKPIALKQYQQIVKESS